MLLFLFLFSWIIQSCSKIDLIDPIGFETYTEADSIVFAVIGDYGKAGEPEEKVANLVKSWNPDFIITTGDNNYEYGEFKTIKRNISDYYGDYIYNFDAPAEYQCDGKAFENGINRFFPSPGNHDADNRDELKPYLNFFTLPQRETYYKFVWGPVSFYSLNSVAENVDEQKNWLYDQLDLSETAYNIVYFHHPPYTTGRHDNTEKMQWDYYSTQVNIVFSGHDHIYSRIEKKGEEGLYYIVNGVGGRNLYDCDSSPLSADEFETFCYDADYGAIKATATFNTLVMEFYTIGQPADPVDRIVIDSLAWNYHSTP
ncbi:MAG: metallophosphoesterase [Bacteroidales bacterium]|nr:metallophosphoesterase [Bacteroidales bacterium]